MKIEISNGTLKLNLHDLFEELEFQLSNDCKEEEYQELLNNLFDELQWHHPAYKNLIETSRNIYCGENYNSAFYEFFKDFFMFPTKYDWESKEELVFKQMSKIMQEILDENATLKAQNHILENSVPRIHDWLYDNYGNDTAYKINSKIYSFYHKDENGKADFELARDMVKSLSKEKYEDMVKKWCDHIYEIFNQENE
jgi:hypothetical protein